MVAGTAISTFVSVFGITIGAALVCSCDAVVLVWCSLIECALYMAYLTVLYQHFTV